MAPGSFPAAGRPPRFSEALAAARLPPGTPFPGGVGLKEEEK